MMQSRMTTFLLTLLIAYGIVLAYLYFLQRNLIYLPDKAIAAPTEYGLEGFRDERAATADGVNIQLWHRSAADGFPTVLYLHGNASHLGNRAGILNALAEKGFGVLGLSYRGYGKSDGSPTEQGLYEDARAAVRFLTETQRLSLQQILLYGESLGSGVAVQMATEFTVGGLILQSPYTSVAGRAAEIYFYIPVRLLIKDRYDSIDKIARVNAPILLFHGDLDDTIPVAHAKTLLSAASAKKKAFFFPHVSHNDFDSGTISAHVLDFAREHRLIAHDSK